MKFFYDPGFAAPIGEHIMPMRKFALVAGEVRAWLPQVIIEKPEPLTLEDLLRVHTAEYVDAVRTGDPRDLAESQKFPWSELLFPSVCLTGGGVLAAARSALDSGASAALASGFHHACADHGEGFCTFNGLLVALEALRAEGKIRTAAILDMDLHYGNGTASLATSRPWLRALSIYGNDYWHNQPFRDVRERHHTDGPNHFSAPVIPSGKSNREVLLETMKRHLPWLIQGGKPDILLYQAGADPLRDDPYSPLQLTHEDLEARDRMVFGFAKAENIPVAWVLAGGYCPEIEKVVRVHLNTAKACWDVFGEKIGHSGIWSSAPLAIPIKYQI
jgi:acetoin utilization deacetylase AcuC-like enzyme